MTTECDRASWSIDRDGDWLRLRIPARDRRAVQALADEIDCVYTVEVKKRKKRRSLDANSYYWVLLTRLAELMDVSTPEAHNIMLRRYGQLEMVDSQVVYLVLPDTEEAGRMVDLSETYHLKPTSHVRAGNDGLNYRTYLMLRGSRSYNTAEMARLINGLISECKSVGIETMTPAEIDEMIGRWDVG